MMSKLVVLACAFLSGLFAQQDKEAALGKLLAEDFEQREKLVSDPAVTGYIERVGQKLAGAATAGIPVHFKVIETGEARVAVLPAGHLYVSSGLIRRLETEAELAFVIGHQLAHIKSGHGRRKQAGPGTIPLVFMGGAGGICTLLTTGNLMPLSFQAQAKSFEEEADRLAIEYLRKAGYDWLEAGGLLDKLKRRLR